MHIFARVASCSYYVSQRPSDNPEHMDVALVCRVAAEVGDFYPKFHKHSVKLVLIIDISLVSFSVGL